MAVKKKFPYRSAVVACNGGCRVTAGDNGCKDGCIGCGACVEKCKFGAISLNEYGVAEIDEEKMHRLRVMWEGMSPEDHSCP